MNSFIDRVSEIIYKPGTRDYYFDPHGPVWMSMTDELEEGSWLDWYTKEVGQLKGKVYFSTTNFTI